jgi:hypothetical protein
MLPEDITAACGLFAFFGSNPTKYFSWKDFKILGVFNDARGNDACGITTNDNVQKYWHQGIVEFKDAIIKKEIIHNFTVKDHILGHTRKASSGGNCIDTAQPLIFYKNDGPPLSKAYKDENYRLWLKKQPKKSIVFSGIHNGTIHNIDKLAEKYHVKTKDKNDTAMLFEILFKGHYEVLTEYEGTASLVFYDYYTEQIYIWRGESLAYSSSVAVSEERPLFYYAPAKNNFYLSSLKNSLLFIGAPENHAMEVPSNTLFVYHKGKLVSNVAYDRSKAKQVVTYSSTGNAWNYRDSNNSWDRYSARHYTPAIQGFHNNKYGNNNTTDKLRKDDTKRLYLVTSGSFSKGAYRLINENVAAIAINNPRRLAFCKGRYWYGNNLAHGLLPVNTLGIIPHKKQLPLAISKAKLYGFIEGVLVEDLASYFIMQDTYNNILADLIEADKIDINDIILKERDLLENLAFFTDHFTDSIVSVSEIEAVKFLNNRNEYHYYTGVTHPKFSNRKYAFENGDLNYIEYMSNISYDLNHTQEDVTEVLDYIETPMEFYAEKGQAESDIDAIGRILIQQKDKDIPISFFTKVLRGEIEYDINTSLKEEFLLAKSIYYKTFYSHLKFNRCDKDQCKDCSYYEKYLEYCIRCVQESSLKIVTK